MTEHPEYGELPFSIAPWFHRKRTKEQIGWVILNGKGCKTRRFPFWSTSSPISTPERLRQTAEREMHEMTREAREHTAKAMLAEVPLAEVLLAMKLLTDRLGAEPEGLSYADHLPVLHALWSENPEAILPD